MNNLITNEQIGLNMNPKILLPFFLISGILLLIALYVVSPSMAESRMAETQITETQMAETHKPIAEASPANTGRHETDTAQKGSDSAQSETGTSQEEAGILKKEPILILENELYGNNMSAIRIRGNRVCVEKCNIYRNGSAGIVVDNDAQAHIRNNRIYSQEGTGITVIGKGSAQVSVTGNQIYQNKMAGLQAGAKEQVEAPVYEGFRKNPTVYFAQEEDHIGRRQTIAIDMRNNRIYDNAEGGIKCQIEYPGHDLRLTASNNSVFKNRKGGFFIAGAAEVVMCNNSICENLKAGVSANKSEGALPRMDIYQNVIRGNEESGIDLSSAYSGPVGVCNNWILNNGGSGIRFEAVPMRIVNNTIVSNGNLYAGSGIDQQGKNTPFIANNVIAYNFKTGLNVKKQNQCLNNLFFANGKAGTCCDDCYSSPSRSTDSGQLGGHKRGKTDLICDPAFNNPDMFDFRLKEWSPAIDAGIPSPRFYDLHFPPSQGGKQNDLGATGGPLANRPVDCFP